MSLTHNESRPYGLLDASVPTHRFHTLPESLPGANDPPDNTATCLQEIASLILSREFNGARERAEQALRLHPSHPELLGLASRACRRSRDFEAALAFDRQRIEHHPHSPEGYTEASENLLRQGRADQAVAVLEAGLRLLPGDPALLHASIRAHAAGGELEQAAAFGATLLAQHPQHLDAYADLIECLIQLGRSGEAAAIIETAYASFPGDIRIVRLKLDLLIRQRADNAHRQLLYRLIKEMPGYTKELLERLHRHELLIHSHQPRERDATACDVCCIAGNEAPYIAEFVHHYLYLGFANIFIGINNSTDQTESIARKLSSQHPSVHVFDVNDTMACLGQFGCYRMLFAHARTSSDSQYCLFVDIDEYWFADPFPTTIRTFLTDKEACDVYSFHWLCCTNEGVFSPPPSRDCTYRWDPHVKSPCHYEAAILNLRCHAPLLADGEGLRVVVGDSVNHYLKVRPFGIELQQQIHDPASSRFEDAGLAWILHRMQRSELEYAQRMLRRDPLERANVAFKSNRGGYKNFDGSPGAKAYINRALPEPAIEAYHRSLQSFLERAGLASGLTEARGRISEAAIFAQLKQIPPEILRRDAGVLRRTFGGTRFHDWVLAHT